MAHVRQTTPDGVARDVSAAMERLRSETAATRLYTMGFCFGGRKSFNQAARQEGLEDAIGFYGLPQRRGEDDIDPPVELVGEYRCKVLGLFGGADQAISADAVEAFRTALDAAQVPNELVTYRGAPIRSSTSATRSIGMRAPTRGGGSSGSSGSTRTPEKRPA